MEHTHKPHKQNTSLSEIILGGQDGLVSILGLLLGLVAATSSSRIVIAGGLATIFAESLSMAAVAYTSKMAERDLYDAERKNEVSEIKEYEATEKQEIYDIYREKGFSGKLLDDIVSHITSDEKLWVDTMMHEELKILPITKKNVRNYTLVVGLSTLTGALLPLIPFFFFGVHSALKISLVLSVIILAVVGLYKANITHSNPYKSALQMVLIGMGAAIAGYLIGLVFKQ